MMRRARSKDKPKRVIRYHGICADAATLGVNRNSLYKVLSGRWVSKSLSARYAALKATRAAQ